MQFVAHLARKDALPEIARQLLDLRGDGRLRPSHSLGGAREPAIVDKAAQARDTFDSMETPTELALGMQVVQNRRLKPAMLTNRGLKVWPGALPETFHTDHWRCRYRARNDVIDVIRSAPANG